MQGSTGEYRGVQGSTGEYRGVQERSAGGTVNSVQHFTAGKVGTEQCTVPLGWAEIENVIGRNI